MSYETVNYFIFYAESRSLRCVKLWMGDTLKIWYVKVKKINCPNAYFGTTPWSHVTGWCCTFSHSW